MRLIPYSAESPGLRAKEQSRRDSPAARRTRAVVWRGRGHALRLGPPQRPHDGGGGGHRPPPGRRAPRPRRRAAAAAALQRRCGGGPAARGPAGGGGPGGGGGPTTLREQAMREQGGRGTARGVAGCRRTCARTFCSRGSGGAGYGPNKERTSNIPAYPTHYGTWHKEPWANGSLCRWHTEPMATL